MQTVAPLSPQRNELISLAYLIPDESLTSVLDYVRYVHEKDETKTPLDAFDYELARRAALDDDDETIPFEQALTELGLTYDDLQAAD